ncbi:TPA: hypothetical protein U1C95_000416 [Streptococcus suis]|nr:hypothetical protein [Streptococcus suis]HEM3682218.1 hypothetical protein [Streptococcus suis]
MSDNDYVKPSVQEKEEYVSPPAKETGNDYVAPPKKSSNDYVAPPKKSSNDYVAPPKKTSSDYVVPPKNTHNDYVSSSQKEFVSESDEWVNIPPIGDNTSYSNQQTYDPYVNPSYFGTPKVGFMFYLTGYVLIGVLGTVFNEDYTLFRKIISIAYFILSNYTYAWFADYQRYKGGFFAWFFTPFGSAKLGWSSSLFANYRKGEVRTGFFGGYSTSSRTDFGAHLLHIIIVTAITEVLKFWIVVPIAFITLFTHKSTIRKYNQLVDQNTY